MVRTFALLSLSATFLHGAEVPAPSQVEFFEKQVRPILANNCYKCHSSQSEKLKGGLRLDSADGVKKGGETGPVIVGGAPEKSRLIEAVRYENPDLQMPPKAKLAPAEIEILAQWIRQGAVWPSPSSDIVQSAPQKPVNNFDLEKRKSEHWAWQPIHRSKPPPLSLSLSHPMGEGKKGAGSSLSRRTGEGQGEGGNPIDRFISAKLVEKNLKAAPPAERAVLVRRLYFDLIGLPPGQSELQQFLQDNSPHAYETLVDRLLASPRFGERWARHWLDLVRYSETLGHEFDYPAYNAWRYRDYVIRAFNADVPYDVFVKEHIAGDLITKPRINPTERFNESIIGTSFYWLGQRDHSPVDVRQHQSDVVENQIDVLSKTFLGLTVACARCHDHKFDAISSADYYSLFGMLSSSRYAQRSIESRDQLGNALSTLSKLKAGIRGIAPEAWEDAAQQAGAYLIASVAVFKELGTNRTSAKVNAISTGVAQARNLRAGLLARYVTALNHESLANIEHPLHLWKYFSTNNPRASLANSTGAHRVEDRDEEFVAFTPGKAHSWFVDGNAFDHDASAAGDFMITGSSKASSLMVLTEPALHGGMISRRLQGAIRSPTFDIRKRYVHVRAAGRDCRIRLCVDNFTMIRDPIYGGLMKQLNSDEPRWFTFDLDMWKGHRTYIEVCDVAFGDPSDDSHRGGYSLDGYGSISRVVFSDSSQPPNRGEIPDVLAGRAEYPESIEQLAGIYQENLIHTIHVWRNPTNKNATTSTELATPADFPLLNWFLRNDLLAEPTSEKGLRAQQTFEELVQQFRNVERSIEEPRIVASLADGNTVDEYVFIRGSHKNHGETVPHHFLTALGGKSKTEFSRGSGRLALADAIVSEDDPLASRVMVNRVWLHLFGRGIVNSPDDFGVLGQRPSHPELLDWLADWFRHDARWSMKELIRLLVTSDTYRMSSNLREKSVEDQDPDNVLLHRMNLRRLEAESIRDSMLKLAGRMDFSMFGQPVPIHLTPFMDGRGRPGSSGPLDGNARRSIYVEVRRNFLSPMLRAFDAPVPASTMGKRTVSNVPAQSLIMMNDPFVIEQARRWAERLEKEFGARVDERIQGAYAQAYGRRASEVEVRNSKEFLKSQVKLYELSADTDLFDRRLWNDFCHVMMNVKEFVFVQ